MSKELRLLLRRFEKLYALEAGKFPLIIKLDEVSYPDRIPTAHLSWINGSNIEPFTLQEDRRFHFSEENARNYPNLSIWIIYKEIREQRIKLSFDSSPRIQIYRREILERVGRRVLTVADRVPQEVMPPGLLKVLEATRRK